MPATPGKRYSAADWNEESSLTSNPYFFSKKLSEQAVWAYAKEHPELEVVVVNPLYVLGPHLGGDSLNQSIANLKKTLMGEEGTVLPPAAAIGVVDVRDVARAFVIAVEKPEAKGQRLLCCNTILTMSDIRGLLKKNFPKYPNSPTQAGLPTPTHSFDTEPLQKLGLKDYIGVEQMLKDLVEALITAKLVPDLR